MTNKTPRVAKNCRESTTPGTRKTGKLFLFLLSFRRASSTSTQSLMMVIARNSSTEQCTSPSLFRNLQVFTRRLQLPTQQLWLLLSRHFLVCTHAHFNHHLATMRNYYSRSLNWKCLAPLLLIERGMYVRTS